MWIEASHDAFNLFAQCPSTVRVFIGKHKLHNEIYLLELHKNVSELPTLDTW